MSTKLKLNGRQVPIVASQYVFEFDEQDFAVVEPPKKRERPRCICGSRSIGIQDYMTGHDDDCPVNENRTPVMGYEPSV